MYLLTIQLICWKEYLFQKDQTGKQIGNQLITIRLVRHCFIQCLMPYKDDHILLIVLVRSTKLSSY